MFIMGHAWTSPSSSSACAAIDPSLDGSDFSYSNRFSMKMGTNRIDQISGWRVKYFYDEPHNPSECMPQFGDSGGPAFVLDVKNRPMLAGVFMCSPLSCGELRNRNGTGSQPGDQGTISLAWHWKDKIDGWVAGRQAALQIWPFQRQYVVYKTAVEGDFNGDGILNAPDLDIIVREARMSALVNRGYNWYLDRNEDGTVNDADVDHLLSNVFQTSRGDVNLDQNFDSTDWNTITNNFTSSPSNVGWAQGDFNGDGAVDATDMGYFEQNQ